MKVLQLCNKPPYPPIDGGAWGMHFLTECMLEKGCDVKVLSVSSDKHPAKVESLPEAYREATRFEAVHIDLDVHMLDAGVSLFCGDSYNVKRYESRDFEAKLIEILDAEDFDVVHVDSIFLTPYVPAIRKHSGAKVILRAHNVEHQIWDRMAKQEPKLMKRWYLKKLALALRMYELDHLNDYDAITCVTRQDADYFRNTPSPEGKRLKRPVLVLPFGIEVASDEPTPSQAAVYHLGAMDWMPNQEGVRWLMDDVWPDVIRECGDARLFLAGRRMPQEMLSLKREGVVMVGEVPDANAFLEDKGICVIPLFSGSGIRVKMIEAMAKGKAVVSTTIGLQGIDAQDGEHLLVADDAKTFADQIVRLLKDDGLRQRLATNARELVKRHYDKHQLAARMVDFYQQMLDE